MVADLVVPNTLYTGRRIEFLATQRLNLLYSDTHAKEVVAALVEGMGLDPIDVGPLQDARWVDGMLILWINNHFVKGPVFDFDLRKTQ